jgi:hypothetical protein
MGVHSDLSCTGSGMATWSGYIIISACANPVQYAATSSICNHSTSTSTTLRLRARVSVVMTTDSSIALVEEPVKSERGDYRTV